MIYIIYYFLISIAIIIALIVRYINYSDIDEPYLEIGCGEEYNLIIFILVGLFWPLVFIASIIILILYLIKNVYHLCCKRFTR